MGVYDYIVKLFCWAWLEPKALRCIQLACSLLLPKRLHGSQLISVRNMCGTWFVWEQVVDVFKLAIAHCALAKVKAVETVFGGIDVVSFWTGIWH